MKDQLAEAAINEYINNGVDSPYYLMLFKNTNDEYMSELLAKLTTHFINENISFMHINGADFCEWDDTCFNEAMDKLSECDFLIFEDVQYIADNDIAQQFLYLMYNKFYLKVYMIFTADCDLYHINIQERIRSRLFRALKIDFM